MSFRTKLLTWSVRASLVCAIAAVSCAVDPAPPCQVVDMIPPPYPPAAISGRVSGAVVVALDVSPEGNVTAATAREGHALLAAAATEALRKWRFLASQNAHRELIGVRFVLAPPDSEDVGTEFSCPGTLVVTEKMPR